jgi:translation initiation factor 4E
MPGTITCTEETATESSQAIVDTEEVSSNGKATQGSDEKTKTSSKNGKKSTQGAAAGPGDWSFPYRLASEWSVWYDRPSAKKLNRSDYSGSMKNIYEFDSVKAFWGLYNHLNLDKMPIGANLRIFKKDINPTWEDPQNSQGGNWILVPRAQNRELAGVAVYKELLLALIGGDLDRLVNGIVLSIKSKDTIIQLWLPNTKRSKREKVKQYAEEALKAYLPQFVDEPGGKNRLEWTWRAHPTVTAKPKSAEKGDGESVDTTIPGEMGSRGSCGECLRTWHSGCAIQ